MFTTEHPVLPFGCGRSYGDVCLNNGGALIDTRPLSRFLAFNRDTGIIQCEAGVTLRRVMDLVVPHGWFLTAAPGTKHVTVGGAIANDVHGKNHHRVGTFGHSVRRFELLRSSGERVVCSRSANADLFHATIGGIGLTGLILWAELQLQRVASAFFEAEQTAFATLDDFFDAAETADRQYDYTVAWIDAAGGRSRLGRGVLFQGRHALDPALGLGAQQRRGMPIPVDLPRSILSRPVIQLFNEAYWQKASWQRGRQLVHYDGFLFPLDRLRRWNRLYGKAGLLQYQCVLPPDAGRDAVRELLLITRRSGHVPTLSVLKVFGKRAPEGLLSFPRPGVTLALDFPMRGQPTHDLMDRLDDVVFATGGALYPAKDARMPPAAFERSFPALPEFVKFVDPRFSSSFWRRVVPGAARQ